ncbi:MAG TPA: hypothetical protein VIF10_05300 [Methylobacter sp.]|jgi:hypothetical protein
MAAITGTQHNPHVKALYQRLQARGKSKMPALGAAMRAGALMCFGVSKTRYPYQSTALSIHLCDLKLTAKTVSTRQEISDPCESKQWIKSRQLKMLFRQYFC